MVIGSWEEVRAGLWRLVLAAASPDNAVTQAGELGELARANSSEAAFRAELQHRVHRRDLRDRLGHLDALVAAAVTQRLDACAVQPGELTWRFLFSLWVLLLRLQSPDTSDRTGAVAMLRPFTKEQTAAAADDLFNRLAGLARHYAPIGATVTKADLMRDLSGWPLADPSSRRRTPWGTGQLAVQASVRRQTPAIDTTVAHSARVWNCWLGGKDNYPVDRVAAEQYSAIFPGHNSQRRCLPGLPGPRSAVSGRRSANPTVPGYRRRPSLHREHAGGRPADRAGVPDCVCRQ